MIDHAYGYLHLGIRYDLVRVALSFTLRIEEVEFGKFLVCLRGSYKINDAT